MSQTADVVIIGGGAVGLACAWALKRRDPTIRVKVLDKGGFAQGGSGRNGAAFRTLWSRDFNVLLSTESLEVFRDARAVFDYPSGIDFNEDGYLLIASDAGTLARFDRAASTLAALKVPSERLTAGQVTDRCPGLAAEGVLGGLFGPACGTLSPFRYLDALLKTCRRLGVDVEYSRAVNAIHPVGGGFRVKTPSGDVNADKVVVCVDYAVMELLAPLGLSLPVTRQKKEAMITEPVRPMLEVSLGFPAEGLFIKQLQRGNFILTLTAEAANPATDIASPGWMQRCARAVTKRYPALAGVAALRSWTGEISRTPDMQSILGETDLAGLYVAVSAYKGIMLSPAMGRVLAEIVLTGGTEHPARALAPSRFEAGQLEPELLTI